MASSKFEITGNATAEATPAPCDSCGHPKRHHTVLGCNDAIHNPLADEPGSLQQPNPHCPCLLTKETA